MKGKLANIICLGFCIVFMTNCKTFLKLDKNEFKQYVFGDSKISVPEEWYSMTDDFNQETKENIEHTTGFSKEKIDEFTDGIKEIAKEQENFQTNRWIGFSKGNFQSVDLTYNYEKHLGKLAHLKEGSSRDELIEKAKELMPKDDKNLVFGETYSNAKFGDNNYIIMHYKTVIDNEKTIYSILARVYNDNYFHNFNLTYDISDQEFIFPLFEKVLKLAVLSE